MKDGTKTEDGKYYIVEDDSAGNPTIGHGLCLKSQDGYLNVDDFSAYGIDSKKLADDWLNNGTEGKVEVEICDSIWENRLKRIYEGQGGTGGLKAELIDLNLTTNQLYALVDVKYRRGNIVGFTEAYKNLWSSDQNMFGKDTSGESFSMSSLYSFFNDGWTDTSSGVNTRKKNQWLLFKYGYFAPLNQYMIINGRQGGTTTTSGDEDYVLGTFTSSITGKTFTLINQNGIMDGERILDSKCNRAAGAIILSGYYSGTAEELVRYTKNIGDGFPYSSTKLYEGYPLKVTNAQNQLSNYKSYIKQQILNGNYVMIRFSQKTIGKSGKQWASDAGHWIAILGYKYEDGIDKIYTADSGWLNNGWFNMNEFDNVTANLQYLYLVEPTQYR